MPNIGGLEILLILLVVLLLFGAKKLPELSRSLGRSARILKTETRALREDDAPPARDRPADADDASASHEVRPAGPPAGSDR